jgi:hypothetical protein
VSGHDFTRAVPNVTDEDFSHWGIAFPLGADFFASCSAA